MTVFGFWGHSHEVEVQIKSSRYLLWRIAIFAQANEKRDIKNMSP
jgi:hypothetical protein